MFAYIGLAKGIDQHNLVEVHREIYAEARKHIPTRTYDRLTGSTYTSLMRMHNDPEYYYSTLPYYAVKPLYILAIRFFHFAGINIVKSGILPTCISVLLLGGLIFIWIKKYIPAFQSFILCAVLLLCSPVVISISMTTPDGLAAFFFLLAAYFLFERKRIPIAIVSLILSIYTRIDFIIPSLFIITHTFLGREIKLKYYLAITASFLIVFLTITIPLKTYGWSPLFYPDYASNYRLDLSGATEKLYSYAGLLKAAFKDLIINSAMLIFMFIGLIAIFTTSLYNKLHFSSDLWIFICIALIILVRIILHPYISDRFFIAYYFLFSILAIKNFRLKSSQ